MFKTVSSVRALRLPCVSLAFVVATLYLTGTAAAQNPILYTTQTNPSAPGVSAPANSYDSDQTWAQGRCSSSGKPFPVGGQTEWTPVLDPADQDAETNLIAVSGTAVYNPQPDESGYCQGILCPGQPTSCSSDSDCSSQGGKCDLGHGPSCTGGSPTPYNSPWTNPQVGSPIACVSDVQCGSCGGVCAALGRSRSDLQATHPFGLDYDVAIAPDTPYQQLLSPGNVESTHLDPNDPSGQTAASGFEDIVYPYLHATTGTTKGWCAPDFKNRCTSSANCPGGAACEGIVGALGVDTSKLVGTLGMETDHDLIPDSYQPHDRDRTVAFGRWIVDCGHGDSNGFHGWHTEIHPPLLVATGRSTGTGVFGAKCSAEQTCSSVIGRPFLVSQNFADGDFVKHLDHELVKLGCNAVTGPIVSTAVSSVGFGPFAGVPDCTGGLNSACVCNNDASCIACEAASCFFFVGPLGVPCSTKIEARARFPKVPFTGKKEMQYYVQPANGRVNPGDRMVAEWSLTARSNGVTVGLSNGGDAAGVLVDITMDHDSYIKKSPSLPSKKDWVIDPGKIYPSFSWGGLLDFAFIYSTPIQAAIVDNGLYTDRRAAPQAPANDSSPTSQFADKLDGTVQAAQTLDDSQPFPVSGRINVGWFRCSPGGPYVAECTGPPTTTVNLTGQGSRDPDGNTISFDWSGGFVGGTASGEMPTLQFPGPTAAAPTPVTSPVTLTLADSQVSTSCDTKVTVQDTTPPAIAISQPAPTGYVHSATLTLNYTVTDICTGVKSFTPTIDGLTTIAGQGWQSGQMINLLTALSLGQHIFSISGVDNAGNAGKSSVTFSIIVTPESIKADVNQFLASGAISNTGLAKALLSQLDAAAAARAGGNFATAANIYQSFIELLQAQSGKGVTATAAAIMIADAQYLITHCP